MVIKYALGPERVKQNKLNFKVVSAGEIVQQIRALAALPEVSGLIPSAHMVAHIK